MSAELVRIVDSISRDKNIEKDAVFTHLEQAIVSAIRKRHSQTDEVECEIDRLSGQISAARNGEPISMMELGRIAAQTAKQVMIQKIREDELGSIFEEFNERKNTVVTGSIARFEGGALIVNLGRAEGFLPRSEQIPGESHHPGERIRALILDVRDAPHQVKIVLSRSHPDLIRRLFELEVPEVAERIIEIKALAREAGYRTKIAVSSIDSKVDAVGACVGVRGSRIKNIVVELGGEKIDIVRWNESSQILIGNALKPAEVMETALCFELGRATVVVEEDQLSLAIGKRGQNVRLAARLTGWDIDILTPTEYNKGLDDMERELLTVEGVSSENIDKMMAMGFISLTDVSEVGSAPLINDLQLEEELAERVVAHAAAAAKRIATETAALKAKQEEERKAAAAAGLVAAESGAGESGDGETDASESDAGESNAEESAVSESADEASGETATVATLAVESEEYIADGAVDDESDTAQSPDPESDLVLSEKTPISVPGESATNQDDVEQDSESVVRPGGSESES